MGGAQPIGKVPPSLATTPVASLRRVRLFAAKGTRATTSIGSTPNVRQNVVAVKPSSFSRVVSSRLGFVHNHTTRVGAFGIMLNIALGPHLDRMEKHLAAFFSNEDVDRMEALLAC